MPDAENPDQPAQASPEASTGWTDVGWTTDADAHILRAYHTPPPALDIDNSRIYAIHDHHVHIGFNTTGTGLTVATVDGTPVAHVDLAEPAPARRETPGQATAGDVVERIDAAVEELCGCGCGRALGPDGPSAYFASQSCQQRWMESQAIDPGDVYSREDAHAGNIDPDAPDARRRFDVAASPPPARRQRLSQESEAFLSYLRHRDEEGERRAQTFNWRRFCVNCNQRSEPVLVGEERLESSEIPRQQCRNCGFAWPGPVITASVTHDFTHERGYVSMRMEADGQVVGMTLNVLTLDMPRNPQQRVDEAWDTLEGHLLNCSESQRRRDQQLWEEWRRRWVVEQPLSFSTQINNPHGRLITGIIF